MSVRSGHQDLGSPAERACRYVGRTFIVTLQDAEAVAYVQAEAARGGVRLYDAEAVMRHCLRAVAAYYASRAAYDLAVEADQ